MTIDTAAPRIGPSSTRGRFRSLNLTMMLPPIVAVGVLIVALEAQNWWHAVVLGLGVASAIVAFVWWSARDVTRVAIPCLVVAAAVWVFGALEADSRMAFFGLAVTGSLAIPQLRRYRAAAVVLLVAFVALVGILKLILTPGFSVDGLIRYLIFPTGLTAIMTGLMFPNKRFYDLVDELEESREREAELAVIRERVRFASDLHDIQGHTLHVVKLKTALAQKLVHTDADRAEQELREIHALVSDTITQTKELAYAQRRLNLAAELENAKNLFEAAGIEVRVERDPDLDTRANELLGQVLRETTTNILRHARATRVEISLSSSGISIVNDGADPDPIPELRGLAALKERIAADGGELTVERSDGRFLTAARYPLARETTRKDDA